MIISTEQVFGNTWEWRTEYVWSVPSGFQKTVFLAYEFICITPNELLNRKDFCRLLRFVRGLIAFAAVAALTMALPFLMWWAHTHRYLRGIDSDAVDYIRWLSIPLLPCAMLMWYIFASHAVLRRRSTYFGQFLVFVTTIVVEYLLLRRGVWI